MDRDSHRVRKEEKTGRDKARFKETEIEKTTKRHRDSRRDSDSRRGRDRREREREIYEKTETETD